jgi:hypothetical protein
MSTETGTTQESCGCNAKPARVCDVCRSATHVYTACSRACLERHLASHPQSAGSSALDRIKRAQQEMNRHAPDTWDIYGAHRARVMSLIPRAASATLGVFGAGNCSDIELEQLAVQYRAVHLIDLDAEALERARERQSPAARARIVTHGGIDLSGFLDRFETWEGLPNPEQLGPLAVTCAKQILKQLAQTFDVTVSTCVLSQLVQPYRQCVILSGTEWVSLDAALTGLHLTTLAGATRSGGHGLIIFDVLSSDRVPRLDEFREADPDTLQGFVMGELERDNLRPDPWNLTRQLGSTGLFAAPRLTPPWLWDIKTARQLVYGLLFDRT